MVAGVVVVLSVVVEVVVVVGACVVVVEGGKVSCTVVSAIGAGVLREVMELEGDSLDMMFSLSFGGCTTGMNKI